MPAPQVPIDVDPATGIWRTDGMPMLYVPRHFLANLLRDTEAALGSVAFRAMLFGSAETSARQWCAAEQRTHGFSALDTFRHYLKRLSQRGYGQFEITALDTDAGTATVVVRNSAFALANLQAGRPVCAMFEGSFAGGLRHVLADAGRDAPVQCEETACLAAGAPECVFSLRAP